MRLLILIFILAFQSLFSQENALLWKIEGQNINQASYLFGTIHMIPKKEYFFEDYMQEAFNSCKHLVMEVDLEKVGLKEQMSIASQMFLNNSQTIYDYVEENQVLDYRTYLVDTLGIKEKKVSQLFRLKPFFASSLIYKEAIGKFKAYEKELASMAKKNNMTTSGLETFQEQINIILSMSVEDQFKSTPYDGSLIREYYKLLGHYKNQRLSIFWDMMKDEPKEVTNKLLLDRNKNWIPEIKNLVSEKPTFIAVGAAHLAGPEGVIALLKKEGYTLSPVK